jgi:hypothetical protein
MKTFLSPQTNGLHYNEEFIDGIKHTHRSIEENGADGFVFQECKQLDFIHSLGRVYLFESGKISWGYICAGYSWYRFNYFELLEKANSKKS